MNASNDIKFVMVPFEDRQINVPEGGLAEFFINRGWQIFSVVDASSTRKSHSKMVKKAMKAANKIGDNVMVVWRTLDDSQHLGYVLYRPDTQA